MSIRDEIIRVYKRKVMAYPEGAIVHMGDCNIYNFLLGICTCGLHHWLWQAGHGVIEELYPDFMKELEEKSKAWFIEYLLREFELNNLYVKEQGEFVKVEEPEPISEEDFDNIMKEFRDKNNSDGEKKQ